MSGQNEQDKKPVAIVAKVDGLIDEIVANFIEESIHNAEKEEALVLVLQVNSQNVILSEGRFQQLLDTINNSDVPVASWVGPSGARATGKVADLVLHTLPIGISPGAGIGKTKIDARERNCWMRISCDDIADGLNELQTKIVNYNEVIERDEQRNLNLAGTNSFEASDLFLASPTLGDMLIQLPNFETKEVKADEDCTGEECLIRLEPVSQVRFTRLSYLDQALHTVASPPVAYLLFSFGLALIVLEYFTAGIGISGVIGAISFILGTYGLVALPTNLWAVILLLVGIFGYVIDIQTGVLRFWTLIGTASFTVGSIFLFDLGLSWLILLIGIASMFGGMGFALPILVRSRFTAPSLNNERVAMSGAD